MQYWKSGFADSNGSTDLWQIFSTAVIGHEEGILFVGNHQGYQDKAGTRIECTSTCGYISGLDGVNANHSYQNTADPTTEDWVKNTNVVVKIDAYTRNDVA